MADRLDPGALLARHYGLPRGPRVCLRLARSRDQEGIRELLDAHGMVAGELEGARLVNFHPARRLVLCATALVGAREQVVGLGVIELGEHGAGGPGLVLTDKQLTDGLEPLLRDALIAHAAALNRARAA
jgi:hypothetical protein